MDCWIFKTPPLHHSMALNSQKMMTLGRDSAAPHSTALLPRLLFPFQGEVGGVPAAAGGVFATFGVGAGVFGEARAASMSRNGPR